MAGLVATYVSATQFTVVGDYTTLFTAGRSVKCNCGADGLKYGNVSTSAYGSPNTTVTLKAVSDAITNNLTEAWSGVVGEGLAGSVPDHNHDGTTHGAGGIAYAVWG
jgi:hypothetical protein